MPGTAMMELDYFDAMQLPDSLSLQEMIERDMRTRAFDECSSAESALLSHTHAKDIDLDVLNSPTIDDRLETLDSELLRDSQNLAWFTTCHTSQNCNLDSDPAGILVNPQTGLPITYQLDTSIDLDLLSDEKDSEDDEERVAKPFNSVNPTMLEHHDANLLKERLARINGGIKHKVMRERNGQKNGASRVTTPGPLRQDFLDDTSSSSSSSSSSSESSSSEEENDEYPNDEDDDDEDFDAEECYFNPTASHTHKAMKTKCPVGQLLKNDEHALALQGANCERALAGRSFPKPAYSYSCLIAMALKNSSTGSLPVSEIYGFMTENYPYFRTAPNGWKNSVRHNLSLNKCFEKIEKPGTGNQRKGCLWTMNPGKIGKMDEEVAKWQRKDPLAIKQSMAKPEHFELLEKGYLKLQVPSRENINGTAENGGDNVDKLFTKIKPEAMQDSNDSNLDNSLLDLNYQSGLWGELDEKMDFDIPLTADNFPNVQVGFAYEDTFGSNTAASATGHAAEVASTFNGTFLSKQLRIVKSSGQK